MTHVESDKDRAWHAARAVPTVLMKTLLPALLLAALSFTAVLGKGGPPINDLCPVDGKAIRVIYRIFTEQGNVSFCCTDCMETWRNNPGRFPVKPKAAK